MRKRKRNGKFTNTDLALAIHEVLDIPLDKNTKYPSEGAKIVAAIVQAMTKALKSGDYVSIKGFGKFTVRQHDNHLPTPVVYNDGEFGPDHNIYSDQPQRFPRKR